jgi:hypothetical protein
VPEHVVSLWHEANVPPDIEEDRARDDPRAAMMHAALQACDITQAALQQRNLAGAVVAEYRRCLAFVHRERDVPQHHQPAVTRLDVAVAQHRLHPKIPLGQHLAVQQFVDRAGLQDVPLRQEHRARAQVLDEQDIVLHHTDRAPDRRGSAPRPQMV